MGNREGGERQEVRGGRGGNKASYIQVTAPLRQPDTRSPTPQ